MATEDQANASLAMDRGIPLGNSLDDFGRRALHTKQSSLEQLALLNQSFMVTTNLITIPTAAETGFLLIKNPSASGKLVRIFHLSVGLLFNNQNGIFRFYVNPTITADGTGLSEVNCRQSSSPIVGVATAFSLPTTTSFGTLFHAIPIQQNSSMIPLLLPPFMTIEPGINFLVTVDNAANNMPAVTNAMWLEVDQ